MIKTLLECGADHGAFVVDSTPLHMAALGGAVDVVDLLMKSGADVNARAPNGYTTPLEAAARYAADIILDFHSGTKTPKIPPKVPIAPATPPRAVVRGTVRASRRRRRERRWIDLRRRRRFRDGRREL